MGQGLSAFNQPAATTALMRRMHPARAMGVSELTAAESGPRENEARIRRRWRFCADDTESPRSETDNGACDSPPNGWTRRNCRAAV